MLNCQLRLAQTKSTETFQLTLSKIQQCPHKTILLPKAEKPPWCLVLSAVRLMTWKAPEIPLQNTATFKATTLAFLVICWAKWVFALSPFTGLHWGHLADAHMIPWVPKTVPIILHPSSGSHAHGIHIGWPSSRFFFLLFSKLKTLKLIFTKDL